MSYPRDLDEFSDAELREELASREKSRTEGLCDYCRRKLDSRPACRFPERHKRKLLLNITGAGPS
jgi:hypothetical protein